MIYNRDAMRFPTHLPQELKVEPTNSSVFSFDKEVVLFLEFINLKADTCTCICVGLHFDLDTDTYNGE